MSIEQQRAAFEAAYIDHGGLLIEDYDLSYDATTNQYRDDCDQSAWWAWQAAIELDRQGRGDPELWCMHILGPDDVHAAPSRAYAEEAVKLFNERYGATAEASGVLCGAVVAAWPHSAEAHANYVETFISDWIAPQPANPTIKESLTVDEPVKEASDDAKEIISLVDTLIASVNEAHHAKRDDWRDACFQSADHTYETIKAKLQARFGQPDPAMAGDDRAAFESWHATYGIEDGKAQAWDAWQAARKRVQPASGEDAT